MFERNLPVSLDGVGVTIDDKLAYVAYVSPTQIDVLAPADASAGTVIVQVNNNRPTQPCLLRLRREVPRRHRLLRRPRASFAQLYQFNMQVPASLAAGDHAVVAQISGVSSPSSAACCFLTVQ